MRRRYTTRKFRRSKRKYNARRKYAKQRTSPRSFRSIGFRM
jgi:hypothetical protein